MAQETIQAIQEAEREALQREGEAKLQADKIVSEARSTAKDLLRTGTDQVRKAAQEEMSRADADQEKILEAARAEVRQDIQELQAKAADKKDAAIQAVMDYLLS